MKTNRRRLKTINYNTKIILTQKAITRTRRTVRIQKIATNEIKTKYNQYVLFTLGNIDFASRRLKQFIVTYDRAVILHMVKRLFKMLTIVRDTREH